MCTKSVNYSSENEVLCGANSYRQKYYFNRKFDKLPDEIKKELQIMCVSFTEEVGGILTLEFDPEGNLQLKVKVDDGDYLYDEIESGLQISKLQRQKEELFTQLELFYSIMDRLDDNKINIGNTVKAKEDRKKEK